jgi:hypothetical protein
VDGFDNLLAAFVTEARAFAKPVVILHGDLHVQRTDTRLVDLATGQPVPNVTRVETFGSPKVGWVEITFDPAGASFVEAKARPVSVPD